MAGDVEEEENKEDENVDANAATDEETYSSLDI